MHFTLRQAEQKVRASKSTILRAIKSGRMSAERTAELREERDRWRNQAERLALTHETPKPVHETVEPVRLNLLERLGRALRG